ncbi:hypothetical protein SKAU_G00179220 [Synaphobranchus kaupii]|uniref:Uncharacterized protein n=1 Tax=Synaphobranchus kaupii TaxID=118154 RepID=A0A9Q1J1L7_SYNKA|nr:hypothetical protein SKAU_G00179220 [Synaphobranchus kaupii]
MSVLCDEPSGEGSSVLRARLISKDGSSLCSLTPGEALSCTTAVFSRLPGSVGVRSSRARKEHDGGRSRPRRPSNITPKTAALCPGHKAPLWASAN